VQSVSLSRDLSVQGYTYAEMARLARGGELTRIRRGAYAKERELDAHLAHRQLLLATVALTTVNSVVSHMSAAVLHGLPIWPSLLSRVHFTREQPSGGKIRRYVHLHVSNLSAMEVVTLEGVRVTSLARTVVDLACTLGYVQAVAVGDAALHQGLARSELEAVLAVNRRRRGLPAARRVIAFLDGRSESVGESASRVAFDRAGLPAPQPQYEVHNSKGRLVGRCDFGWENHRTLGEFDGKTKYGRLLMPGQDPSDVVFAEKRREDALRDLGWQVVRWIWDDLDSPTVLAERIQRAFSRAERAA
jgi:hypothetical protein